HPGTQTRLVEDDRDRSRPGERPVGVPLGLHAGGEVEHRRLLGRVQVVVAQEVSYRHAAASTDSIAAGSAARNASACSVVMMKGGASRTTSDCTGLTRKPASTSAAARAAAAGRRSVTPSSR